MNTLHILKSAPDDNTMQIIDINKAAEERSNIFLLYECDPDYEELIEQIFSHDNVISW